MKVQVCNGKSCSERFCKYTKIRLESDKQKFGYENLLIEDALCMGECKKVPNIKIGNHIENYINPAKAAELVAKKIRK